MDDEEIRRLARLRREELQRSSDWQAAERLNLEQNVKRVLAEQAAMRVDVLRNCRELGRKFIDWAQREGVRPNMYDRMCEYVVRYVANSKSGPDSFTFF